jgi:hypothetical protein
MNYLTAEIATITGNGQYGVYAKDSGVVYLSGATIDNTNTGVGGQIVRAIGSAYIYSTAPGSGGLSTLTASNFFPRFNTQTSSGAYIGTNTQDDATINVYGMKGPDTPPTNTIASGVVTPTSSWARVDTEGVAATDDLTSITPTNVHIWYIRTASSSRDVTLKHNAGGATNPILLNGGVDKTLTSINEVIVLVYNPISGYWIEPK